MDAAEYKHIVLGLIFLKYISDSFENLYRKLQKGEGEYEGADPEDVDEYRAENVFLSLLKPGGIIYFPGQNNPASGRMWMLPWKPFKGSIPR